MRHTVQCFIFLSLLYQKIFNFPDWSKMKIFVTKKKWSKLRPNVTFIDLECQTTQRTSLLCKTLIIHHFSNLSLCSIRLPKYQRPSLKACKRFVLAAPLNPSRVPLLSYSYEHVHVARALNIARRKLSNFPRTLLSYGHYSNNDTTSTDGWMTWKTKILSFFCYFTAPSPSTLFTTTFISAYDSMAWYF